MPKPDWEAIHKEMVAEQERFKAFPKATEDTIKACLAALKVEGCPQTITVSGTDMTLDDAVAKGFMPLEDLQSLLTDWRYLKTLKPKT